MTLVLASIGLLLGIAAAVLLVPALVLCAQVLASLRRPVDVPDSTALAGLRIGVLMPAHNESAGIGAALLSVRRQLEAGDRLLVVADNCDDDTASVARAGGAEVVERRDPVRRGKGYALDYGMRRYAAAPVDVLVVVDADCELHAGALRRVARLAASTGRPVQALYLMRSPPGAGVKTRVAEFAWRVKNQVRPLGGLAMGWPCQLMGTGMAFPWAALDSMSLASGHLVEDMELGLQLAAAHLPPLFCPFALVTSTFATDDRGARSQRTRWEHGHLAMIAAHGLPTLLSALRTGRPALAAMALDLCVPPLASLVLAQTGATLLTGAWWLATGSAAAFGCALIGSLATATAILTAWSAYARDIVTGSELNAIPGYVFCKIPLYLRWFTGRQTEWIRTQRDKPPK